MMGLLERPRKVREHHPGADHNDTREVIVMAENQSTNSLNLDEIWLPIHGYEGYYEVSDKGRVRSVDRTIWGEKAGTRYQRVYRGRDLVLKTNKDGYSVVCMSKENKRRYFRVHRLVLETFVGPCPEGMEVCHNNGNPADNRLTNLRYGTKSENAQDIIRHGHNWNRDKTKCPRGHVLSAPNLDVSLAKRGWRRCLSCKRASQYVGDHSAEFLDRAAAIQIISDQNYKKLAPKRYSHE